MYVETFAQKLVKARKDARYTQKQVADALNLNRSTLANYEIGRIQPDIETLGKLADFYHVSLDWLVGTVGHSIPYSIFLTGEEFSLLRDLLKNIHELKED